MNCKRLFFFGDSICVGQHVSVHRTWVAKISNRLEEVGREFGCRVVVSNASTNGRTTRQALEAMSFEVLSHAVDMLFVQFGLNDCNYWKDGQGVPRVSEPAFVANLGEILQRARRYGVKHMWINTNHPTGRTQAALPHTSQTYEESNRRYNELIRQVAAEEPNVECIDIEAIFDNHVRQQRVALTELLMPAPDLLHLSEAGHDLYFSAVCPRLELRLREILQASV